MSTKYRFADKQGVYFTTSTVVGWLDVFTRDIYRDIVLDSIRFCQQNQGLAVHAWVLMTNHLHMICSFHEKQEPALVLKNMKSFTAIKLIDAIINNPKESRREYMLDLLEAEGKKSSSNFRFKFWEHENHPVILDSDIVFDQKINYLHWNPVTAGFVTNSQQRLFALAVRAGRTLRQYKGKSKISGARFVSLGYARKTNHTIPKRYVFHHLYLPSMVAAD